MNRVIGTPRGLDPHRPGAVGPPPLGMLHRGKKAAPEVAPEDSPGSLEASARALVCAACGHPITTADARLIVDGAHVHTRTNPHGHAFTFGCFSTAPGCTAAGAPSLQATWFPGHFWWVELCAACRVHLGWHFFADGGAGFHGLVLDRLREVDS